MRHSRSSAEVEIRDAVVARFRALMPDARIVHELNMDGTGSNRADLVAIQETRITICEIKSARDKTLRLAAQLHAFGPCCHTLIVAAHEKWFLSPVREKRVYHRRKGEALVNRPDGTLGTETRVIERAYEANLPSPMQVLLGEFPHWTAAEWKYPEPEGYGRWLIEAYQRHVPWSDRLLHLLWRDELHAACMENRINVGPRATRSDMVRWILKELTGPQIEAAACRALRRREFTEADPPMLEGGTA